MLGSTNATAELMPIHYLPDAAVILRGQDSAGEGHLPEDWQGIVDDPALKQEALQDIVARWQAQGWWDGDVPPQGSSSTGRMDEFIANALNEHAET